MPTSRAGGCIASAHVPLPGCGHVPMGDDPELIVELVLQATAEQPAAA